jgi:hypothetical protein
MTHGIPVYPTTADEVGDAAKAYAQLATEDGCVDPDAAIAALRSAADELEGEQ